MILEGWLKTYVDDWSDCDDLCSHSIRYFIYKYPQFIDSLEKWSVSKSRWLRRASEVTLIYSLRKCEHIDRAFELTSKLILDLDDLVQKEYGWMLKEASKNFP